ncbi:hypothetical protein TNCV_3211131 [Trichonephila clavipes]|uniref:Uncharacterized protein n=1 Tax=Trichonephila clavipes TaxID=2585209 RepID=A0A8X6S2V2_TRICX|nr:hypothetical protein TNCV_3211131 [Trichonephila clavipes]
MVYPPPNSRGPKTFRKCKTCGRKASRRPKPPEEPHAGNHGNLHTTDAPRGREEHPARGKSARSNPCPQKHLTVGAAPLHNFRPPTHSEACTEGDKTLKTDEI